MTRSAELIERRKAEALFLKVAYKPKRDLMVALLELSALARESQRGRIDHWETLHELKVERDGVEIIGGNFKVCFRKHVEPLQGGRCCYCQIPLLNIAHAKPIDHVLPRSIYPQFSLSFWNLAVACHRCNSIKKAADWGGFPVKRRIYPETKYFSEMFHPRFHAFKDHVYACRYQEGDLAVSVFVGLTAQGRHLCRNLLGRVAEMEIRLGSKPELQEKLDRVVGFEEKAEELGVGALKPFVDELLLALRGL